MRILYVDIDSLRPDHLGCYGYERPTSPNIDRIAAEGAIVAQCYTSDAPCLPSRTTFFGLRLGIKTGIVNHGGTNADQLPEGPLRGFQRQSARMSFGEALRNADYRTVQISSFPHRHSAFHVSVGFGEVIDPGGDGSGPTLETHARAEDWLARNGAADSWFMHVNFWDPHTPYDTPLEFGHPFAAHDAPAWITEDVIERQRASYGPQSAHKPFGLAPSFRWPRGAPAIKDRDSWKAWIDGYDTGIAYADAFVGRLVDQLDELGVLEETAIVVHADHGESQGELNVYGDHHFADEYTCHVPCVVRWPGVTDLVAGRTVSGFVYSVDLAATILDLAGCEVPATSDGQSFATGLERGELDGRTHLVLQQGAWSCQRAARWDNYLLIRSYHTGFHDLPAICAFDLASDPHLQEDLASARPDLVADGLGLVEAWVDRQLAARTNDPLRTVMAEGGPYHAAEYRGDVAAVLRDLGRDADADRLEADDGRPRNWVAAR
jgi:choline-sulfatase